MNAVITGASKGIGKAIALRLAERGMNLAICSRGTDELYQFQDLLVEKFSGQTFIAKKTDMSDRDSVKEFFGVVRLNWENIDVLVNNAGIYIPGEVKTEEEGILELLMNVNLFGPYQLTRSCLPLLRKDTPSYIFNICSIAGLRAYTNGGSYSITKFAMNGFSKALRDELKEDNIKVCTIHPGATWTSSWSGTDLPEERLMAADDVAQAVLCQLNMSPSAVMEDIILRPQLGDL